jgi:hypothetical protein
MTNRFKNPMLRKQYDACIACYRKKHRDLVRPDGTPHRGNTIATYFWRGFEGVTVNWDAYSRGAPIYAAYRAGQTVRATESKSV